MDSDSSHEDEFNLVHRDAVPAPKPQKKLSPEEQRATVQKWLQPTDYNSPGNEYMKHLHSHIPGTGSSVRTLPAFVEWSNLSSRPELGIGAEVGLPAVLHVRGVAGSGKSVFAASIIRQLQDAEPSTPILFFFFRQIVEKNHSVKYMIRDFASQLLPYSQSLVARLFELSQTSGVDGKEFGPVWEAILQTLSNMLNSCCVVDALDEMDDQDIDFIDRLLQIPSGTKLLVTSRPVPRVEDALTLSHIKHLKLEPTLLYPDVTNYVDVRLMSLQPSLRPETEERVKQTICDRAQGLFLHARLLMDSLYEGLDDGSITEDSLPDTLERLPTSLKGVYEEMLNDHARRSGVSRELQVQILMCVTYSSRPLRLLELGSLIVNLGLTEDLKEGKSMVRASCGRLLEILDDETVSVIHHSFTEFLHGGSRQEAEGNFPILNEHQSHRALALLSLKYLNACKIPQFYDHDYHSDYDDDSPASSDSDRFSQRGSDSQNRDRMLQEMQISYPLLKYTIDNFNYHLERSANLDPEILEAVHAYLVPGTPAFRLWCYRNPDSVPYRRFSAIHLAACASLPVSVMEKLVMESGVDMKDGGGQTALSHAARHGHTKVVSFLLAEGADPRTKNRENHTPLHHAATCGHLDVAQLLLEAGASPLCSRDGVNDKDSGILNTPLHSACMEGNTGMITLFLPHVPANLMNYVFHSVRGAENVDLILRTGQADINSHSGGRTKLFRAAALHDLPVMQVLFQYGADANKRCTGQRFLDVELISTNLDYADGPMPIHAWAGYEGKIMLLRDDSMQLNTAQRCFDLLIENGADIEAITSGEMGGFDAGSNLTPLFYVVDHTRRGNMRHWRAFDQTEVKLATILLDAGADPNARSRTRMIPLHVANPENPSLFDVLITRGSDINAKNERGRIPVLELLDNSSELNIKLLEKLIQSGSDLSIADNAGDTMYHHIVRNINKFKKDHAAFLKHLPRVGDHWNTRNERGVTSVHEYPILFHKDDAEPLLQALVDGGMNVNMRTDRGFTIFHTIARNLNAIDMFIRLGADVRLAAEDGSTLLHSAIKQGASLSELRQIASRGVGPLAEDSEGNTLVHLGFRSFGSRQRFNAVESCQETIDLWQKFGLSLSQRDRHGLTALHLASHFALEADEAGEDVYGKSVSWLDFVLKTPAFAVGGVDTRDPHGATALHYAAAASEFAVAKLLRAGADPTLLTEEGVLPLHLACRARKPNTVRLLLEAHKKRSELDRIIECKDTTGLERTPLHTAARSGVPETVMSLLAAGANVDCTDVNGLTPLHVLAEFPQENALWLNPPRYPHYMVLLNDQNRPPNLAWQLPVECVEEVLDVLLSAGANVEAVGYVNDSPVVAKEVVLKCEGEYAAHYFTTHNAESTDTAASERDTDLNLILSIQKGSVGNKVRYSAIKRAAKNLIQNKASLREFIRRGGNITASIVPQGDHVVHSILTYGRLSLLKEIEGLLLTTNKIVNPKEMQNLLVTSCDREVPNLHMIKFLVERLGFDLDASSDYFYPFYCSNITALHMVAGGLHFWQIEAMEYMLSQGADVEVRDGLGRTPLLMAVRSHTKNGFWKVETIRILLHYGADPNAVDGSGKSCLALADGADITKLLLEYGAEVEKTPNVISEAIVNRDVDMIELLINAGADPNFVFSSTRERSAPKAISMRREEYPLHTAACQSVRKSNKGNQVTKAAENQVLQTLLGHGADLFAQYENGSNVLQCIAEEGGELDCFLALENLEFEKRGQKERTLLLSACACQRKIRQPTSHSSEQSSDLSQEHTLWQVTAQTDAILRLVELGAVLDVADDSGNTSLHLFCVRDHSFNPANREAFLALLQHCPSVIHMADNDGFKPLHRAMAWQHYWAVNVLVDHGADFMEPDPNGDTALHHFAGVMVGNRATALEAGHEFTKFLDRGLDINARNTKGQTPIMICLAKTWETLCNDTVSHGATLDVFLEAKADVFVADNEGSTLLHYLARRPATITFLRNERETKDFKALFKRLMDMGLDPRKEDAKLMTAIDLAVARQKWDIMEMFNTNSEK